MQTTQTTLCYRHQPPWAKANPSICGLVDGGAARPPCISNLGVLSLPPEQQPGHVIQPRSSAGNPGSTDKHSVSNWKCWEASRDSPGGTAKSSEHLVWVLPPSWPLASHFKLPAELAASLPLGVTATTRTCLKTGHRGTWSPGPLGQAGNLCRVRSFPVKGQVGRVVGGKCCRA